MESLTEGNFFAVDSSYFSLQQTLECGQCFRYRKEAEGYFVVAFGKQVFLVEQGNQILFYGTTKEDMEKIWIPYFDLNRDYGEIYGILGQGDQVMAEALSLGSGIRLLQQEFFECLVSFIISQNNHIPRIKKIIEAISSTYGKEISPGVFAFPTVTQLAGVTEEEFRFMGAGFRGPYLVDAVDKVARGVVDVDLFSTLDTPKLKEKLMEIKGVGTKVADCVLLFSCGRRDMFPVDVWVRRVMSVLYLGKENGSEKEIHGFAKEKFGDLGGYAQQVLFYYAREKKIGR